MLIPQIDPFWNDLAASIKDDILEDYEDDNWIEWINPLSFIAGLFEPSPLQLRDQTYEGIQSEGNERFERYWDEKMKRQKGGEECPA